MLVSNRDDGTSCLDNRAAIADDHEQINTDSTESPRLIYLFPMIPFPKLAFTLLLSRDSLDSNVRIARSLVNRELYS